MKKYLFILLLAACGPTEKDAKLVEAGTIHDEALEIGQRSRLSISELNNEKVTLNQNQLDSLDAISTDLGEWYESLVEVPGHKHEEHNHDHDHDHDHGNEENYLEGLPAEEVLAIQVALRTEIRKIEARIINLKNDIQ